MPRFPFLLLIAALVFPIAPRASQGPEEGDRLNALSRHPVWLKLVHYEAAPGSASGLRSAIASGEFFLSSSGREDPRAELEATLVEIRRPLTDFEVADLHPRCRFPARTLWLRRVLPGLEGVPPLSSCGKFLEWSRWEATESLSVVFVTGYLGNPASFYGHLLLKMNSSRQRGTTRLIDVSVNYGALIPPDENPVAYIFKGLTGGYDAGFSHIDYYYHDHNYGETELRDMWEYELGLDLEESRFVIAHAWEVLGKRYTYYFLRRNCAYRVGELVEIVEGVEVVPRNPLYVMPQSLVRKMAEARHGGRALVRAVRFHPSRQSRFYERFRRLRAEERRALARLVEEAGRTEVERFAALPLSSRRRVLDAAIDYYQYVRQGGDLTGEEQEAITRAYQAVLAARYRLPPGEEGGGTSPPPAPHRGRSPGYASVGITHVEEVGGQLSLRLRPAYYDALDGGPGHVSRSALAMGDLEVRRDEAGLFLDRLDLFHVRSVNDRYSGLPGDTGLVWALRVGMERPEVACTRCAVPRAQAEVGTARRMAGGRLLGSWSIGGSVQEARFGFGRVSAGTGLRADLLLPASAKMAVEYRVRRYLEGKQRLQHLASATLRVPLAARWDIRLAAIDDGRLELGASIGFYW